jgi:ubiquinone/menaquinone biosynthesis C-methylase UbiE
MNDEPGEGRFAGLYDLAFNPVLRRVHYTIVSLAKKYECHSLVDLGSGTGEQARVLAAQGFSITGIDASYQMINVAKQKSDDSIRFIHEDITKVQIPDTIFDAANISLVLHPNTNEIITEIVHKAKKLVKTDGVIFITDYGKGIGLSGWMAGGIMRIIESLAKPNHRRNYFSFMKQNGIDMFSTIPEIHILERQCYYHGALQTMVISFSHQ